MDYGPWAIIAVIAFVVGIGYGVGQVNSDRTAFKTFMSEVRDDIKMILSRLPAKPFDSASPIRLKK